MSYKLDSNFIDLNEKQKDTVFALTALNDFSQIPKRFDNNEKLKINDNFTHKIQLSVEFYNWLDDIERKIDLIDQNIDNNKVMLEIKAKQKLCDTMHNEVSSCLDKLENLKNLYLTTSTKTNTLHEACESLLRDQNTHSETTRALEENLHYFVIVDNLSLKISFPNLKVSVENLRPILDQIDESYKFLSSKPNYRETGSYLNKLEELLTAILQKIYSYFVQEINNTFSQFSSKEEISPDKSFTILYGRFRTQAIKIRPFFDLISSRKDVWKIYADVMENCENYFLSKREQLLYNIISCSIDDLVAKFPRDHCAFIRNGGALMIRLCDDEINLYQQFFTKSDLKLLKEMLVKLCTILYDAFRPSIIHINHLETLAELCCILKVELVENYSDIEDTENSPINRMCQMTLEDVQERLVYRTHVYIKSQIFGYTPSSGDLAYPEKLEMMISIAESMRSDNGGVNKSVSESESTNYSIKNENKLSNETSSNNVELTDKVSNNVVGHGDLLINPGPNMSLSPADLHGMWYPTVRRTLVCLSKLQRCLDITTFQGLAQDCVAQCVQSLVSASNLIEKNKTVMDAQLFLIKHLLILREQVAPFNVEFTVKETSLAFSNIKNAAVGLITSRSQILALNRSNSLIRFLLETPQIIETIVDSRHQLDGQLKLTCDKFISDSVTILAGPINEFLNKISSIELLSTESKLPVNVRHQPFAEISRIQEILTRCNRELSTSSNANSKFITIRRSLRLYLANPDTENILLRPIKQSVLQAYRNFNNFLTTYFTEEDCHIISCPSEKQISLKMEVNLDNLSK